MVSRLAYWDKWNWNVNYKHMSAGNNSLWDTSRPHNKFQPAILNEQQEEPSWHICRCRHSAHHYAWHMSGRVDVWCKSYWDGRSEWWMQKYWALGAGRQALGHMNVECWNARMHGGRWWMQGEYVEMWWNGHVKPESWIGGTKALRH